MTAPSFKTIVLDFLQQGHRDEEAFLQELSETERTAIGTPDFWSAKDHLAHMTYAHQKLATILQQEVPPSEEGYGQMVFEKHKSRPWSDIHAESERVYADLIKLIEQLGEEDLTPPDRFSSISEASPLYAVCVGLFYEHNQEHIAQYYSDRHDLPRAIEIRERCAGRIMQAEVPEWLKGSCLYNLACFYAQQQQLENAAVRLREALTLAPDLKEYAKSDPDLAALRDQSA